MSASELRARVANFLRGRDRATVRDVAIGVGLLKPRQSDLAKVVHAMKAIGWVGWKAGVSTCANSGSAPWWPPGTPGPPVTRASAPPPAPSRPQPARSTSPLACVRLLGGPVGEMRRRVVACADEGLELASAEKPERPIRMRWDGTVEAGFERAPGVKMHPEDLEALSLWYLATKGGAS